ncbi:hypothetical protein ACHWQZ_G010986 [Mnemiopsis leidyi]
MVGLRLVLHILTSAHLVVLAAINTSGDQSVTTGRDQIISCSITGLKSVANVKWIDPENVDVPADDATDYAVDIGLFSEGVQTTKLTIKTTKLVSLNSAGTYKCSVTSTLYAGSPSSQKTVTITPIVVTAVNKEVLSGTDQVVISCQVTGITAALGTVKWTDPNGKDVTTLDTVSSYKVDDGTLQNGNSQTTTLTVASDQTIADKTYNCVLTPASPDDATEVGTNVSLDVYTINTSGDRSVTTGKDQIISCFISGLGNVANVKWIDPKNVDVPTDYATDYAVDIGSFSEGVQTTKLTIKTTKLVSLNSAGTYKCSVTSTLYAGSPSSQKTVTVTPILVTAVNKEVLSGTDQVVLSCQVTGITAALGTVKWTDSNGKDVTTLHTASSYTIVDGSLQNGNSQTTTLTVASDQTIADKTYNCVLTPASQDDATGVGTNVSLDVYTINTSGDRSVTTGKDQIISCFISGLGNVANVKWIDPKNVDVPTDDATAYDVDVGLFSEGVQTTKLTIKTTKLVSLNSAGTYKCLVTSTFYAGSPSSQKTVTVTPILVTAVNKEVLSGTDQVVISCQVTGITAALGIVKWTDPNGKDVTTLDTVSSFMVDDGTLQNGNSQTTTLTVASDQTTADKTYSCVLTPASQDDATEIYTSVVLNIYRVEAVGAEVREGTRTEISCIISDVLSEGVSVSWMDVNTTLTENVETSPVNGKQQISKLTVENPTVDKVYTCFIRSNTYNRDQAYPVEVNLDVYGCTTDDYTRTGNLAEVRCAVVSPTDKLFFAWYSNNQIIPGTSKEAMPNETTSNKLMVEALTVDTTYTCKVQSRQEYTFLSIIEVNGINI